MPAEPASAAQARRFLRELLGTWGREPLEEAAALLLTELVANALLHAKSEVHVTVRLVGDVLRVEVADDSPRQPRRRRYGLDATTGRGLSLVATMARDWGSTPRGPGKVVWFEVDGTPPALARQPKPTGGAGGPKQAARLRTGGTPGSLSRRPAGPPGPGAPACRGWPALGLDAA